MRTLSPLWALLLLVVIVGACAAFMLTRHQSPAAQFVADEQGLGEKWISLSQQIKAAGSERNDLAARWMKLCKARNQTLGQDGVTLLPGCVDVKSVENPQATPMKGTVTVPAK